MSIARNSVLALIPQIVGIFAAVFTSVITARYLGPAGRGVLSLALMSLAITLIVADGGISAAVTYLVSSRRVHRAEGFGLCLGAATALGILALLAAALLWPLLAAGALRGVSPVEYAAALAALPAMLFASFWTRLNMALGEFKGPLRLHASVSVASLVLAAAVLLFARQGVRELVMALTALHWVIAIVLFVHEWARHGRPLALPPGILRQALAYGVRSYAGSIVSAATLRIDAFVLNAYSGSGEVGRYTMAVALTEKLWLVDSSVGQAALPEVIARESDPAAKLVAASNRMVILLTATGGFVLFAAAPLLVDLLYGPGFDAAATAIRILVPGAVASASGRTLLHYHQGHLARPGTVSTVLGISAVLGITLYFALIPGWGLIGAATASSIAYASIFVMAATLFRNGTGMALSEMLVPGRRDVASLMARVSDRTR